MRIDCKGSLARTRTTAGEKWKVGMSPLCSGGCPPHLLPFSKRRWRKVCSRGPSEIRGSHVLSDPRKAFWGLSPDNLDDFCPPEGLLKAGGAASAGAGCTPGVCALMCRPPWNVTWAQNLCTKPDVTWAQNLHRPPFQTVSCTLVCKTLSLC